ncbi:MAG: glycosyltransferase [Magnetococcales bacterium]|nr:glycosyltransferase [Magnetococcales bacterium]
MEKIQSLIFLQKRAGKAGAQTCLARLLQHPKVQAYNPVLVTGETGWLTGECDRLGVARIVRSFPSSRSLKGRLWQNRLFARQIAADLDRLGRRAGFIQGNDYLDGLLTQALAKKCQVPSGLFLRSSKMALRDYTKYRCDQPDHVALIAEQMYETVKSWGVGAPIELILDGVYPEEFSQPKPRHSDLFPNRVLVIGSEIKSKGWSDLTQAIYQLEQSGRLNHLILDFTGDRPECSENDLKLERFKQVTCNFLGRVEQFQELVQRYELVINPSRQECSGMASLEVVAAGVPLLTSRTGVMEQVISDERFLFRPHDPLDLQRALQALVIDWSHSDSDWGRAQERIIQQFNIHDSVAQLVTAYEKFWPDG